MRRFNPLDSELDAKNKFITIGEIMLRLSPPDYEKIRTANSFTIGYGGSEANIAISLANLGIDSTFFSAVPDHSMGKSAIRWLRSNDVHCSPVILTSKEDTPSLRMGIYYLEMGYGIRASNVIYDRKHSAITEFDFSQIDLKALLSGFGWLHLSGITPALSDSCADLVMNCLKIGKELGMTISFDGNFRSALWTWEAARDFCTKCLPYIDVLFGTEPFHLWKDEEDHSKGDWKDDIPFRSSLEEQDFVFRKFVERYPNLKVIARHVRYVHSGSENSLKAYVWHAGKTYESRTFRFTILDRVGGGDAFASGLIYALMKQYEPEEAANFAIVMSAIKHTMHGDGNITDNVDDVRRIMDMQFEIKR